MQATSADLLLIENRRPRVVFLCLLPGGLIVGITINSQKAVSAGVDLALGLLLLSVGALAAMGRLHGRRKAPVPAVAASGTSRRGRRGRLGGAGAGRAAARTSAGLG